MSKRVGLPFPFSAVVGVDEAKLALLLATVDRSIGGVLLRGEKGSAKTTLARGLASLLPEGAPFVELPLGATEERVVGSLDLAAALGEGKVRFQPGLLAAAHGGVLYVDEINLLADHLVDVLLDVAVSGINRVERDGLSHEHPARFVLVGSMNPEEGDLRPQLLDRFGLAVDVRAPGDPALRAEAVRRRLAFDAEPVAFRDTVAVDEKDLSARLADAEPALLDDQLLVAVAALCAGVGAEGLRADLMLARAAAAHAGWHQRSATTPDDVRAVASLVLGHRARRHPLDPPGTPPAALDDALDEAFPPDPPQPPDPSDDDRGRDDERGERDDRAEPSSGTSPVIALQRAMADAPAAAGRRSPVTTDRGRVVGHRRPQGAARAVAIVPTLTAAAQRQAAETAATATAPAPAAGTAGGPIRSFAPDDLREPVRQAKAGNLLVLAVDASGSMGAEARMAAVKGALLGLLVDAYQRRDRVALVTFGGRGAHVALRPTASVEIARTRLDELPTGGETPLAEGIRVAADLATQAATPALQPIVVVVTDGRATGGDDPVAAALAAADVVARRKLDAVLVDVEPPGPGALGLGRELAARMGARHLSLPELTAGRLEAALRSTPRG